MKPCNKTIKKAMSLVKAMIDLSDEGDAVREDTGCGVLYGVIRDSAYKIKKLAEAEKAAHIKKGWWKNEPKDQKSENEQPQGFKRLSL